MKKRLSFVAALAVAGLVLTGCGSGSDSPSPGEGDTDPIVVATQKPTSLIPGNSRGFFALDVAETLFTGLVKYDDKTGEPVGVVAKEVTSTDQKTWNITLNEGWKFHNGEPVDAESFARAWNAAADPKNAWLGSATMSLIEGYAAFAPKTGEATATSLSGIVVKSPTELSVTLNNPNSQFPYMLGQPAFYPLPEAALKDLASFGTMPIGNGPYKMVEPWTGGDEIRTVRFDDYGGEKAKNAGVTFRVYSGYDISFRDFQAGEVDITSVLSTDREAAKAKYPKQYFRADVQTSMAYLSVPTWAPGYDDPRIRKALSMAIDRQQIIDTIFKDDAYKPMTDIGVPAAAGYRTDACDYCKFDPKEAKRLWDEAGGLPELNLTVVSGAGRDAYSEAIINMWEKNLGAKVSMDFIPSENTHASLFGKDVKNPASLARASDYPSPYSVLGTSFLTGGPSNYMFYSNSKYDSLIKDALAAGSLDEAQKLFDQAKDIVIEEMPIIPLWTSGSNYVVSERVATTYKLATFNKSPYSRIEIK